MSKVWKKEDIVNMLKENPTAVLVGMLRIYDLQTVDEKAVEETTQNNGVGYNGFDGKIMSNLSTFFLSRKFLTEKQFNVAKKIIIKYAGQLTKIANNEISVIKRNFEIPANWLSKPKNNQRVANA